MTKILADMLVTMLLLLLIGNAIRCIIKQKKSGNCAGCSGCEQSKSKCTHSKNITECHCTKSGMPSDLDQT